MNIQSNVATEATGQAFLTPAAPDRETLESAARRAAQRIAPLWPLQGFVAVNPFMGLREGAVTQAAARLGRVAGARTTMPRAFYAEALDSGRIGTEDLAAACAQVSPKAAAQAAGVPGVPRDPNSLAACARTPSGGSAHQNAGAQNAHPRLATVADVIATAQGTDLPRFVTDRISTWAAGYFDAGQASWPSPWRDLAPYAAWRAESLIDRTPEVSGLRGWRQRVHDLPDTPGDLLALAVERLEIGAAALELYCHRLLGDIGGWAAYARYHEWTAALEGRTVSPVTDLLAIRAAWDLLLLDHHGDDPAVVRGWDAARAALETAAVETPDAAATVDWMLQAAYEHAWQRDLFARIAPAPSPATPITAAVSQTGERPAAQAVFCIDVRSEVFRRSLEAAAPKVETLGFAGFFGMPIEYVPAGQDHGEARCPGLLAPSVVVHEGACHHGQEDDPAPETALHRREGHRRRFARAWNALKLGAVSCFLFVEGAGLAYAGKLVSDSLALRGGNKAAATVARGAPRVAPRPVAGRDTGLPLAQQLDLAEGALKGMSLRDNFARLVVFVGHAASTVNNPHASGLDCGACAGQGGEVNARLAAAILNDPAVRAGLAERGLTIPEDTIFLGALHDTTTDTVALADTQTVPDSHAEDLAALQAWLTDAGHRNRRARAPALGLDAAETDGARLDRRIRTRGQDWSQIRPEWGLAGCAAFIAAPRSRTLGRDLDGRAFLHAYDWRQDADFAVLAQIMTAPLVVASWITMQYYASTVDNRVFGSGDKVLHNVAGTLGVLEGNGGDLRVGLPWQSLHDGTRLIHEPMRLTAVIEAPFAAIDSVLTEHDMLRDLVNNAWVHLAAIDPEGRLHRRDPETGTWTPARTWTPGARPRDKEGPVMSRLNDLENESVYILREAHAHFGRLGLLWSLGKDSNVLIWLVRKAFLGHVPFPVIHLDTEAEFDETYAFRDRYAREWDLDLIAEICPPLDDIDPDLPPATRFAARKSAGLKQCLAGHGFEGVILGIRRDEQAVRAKERVFSARDDSSTWDFRDQQPEFWGQYNTTLPPGGHMRVHPLLHWTEIDIWRYIERENIPLVPLYFAQDGYRYRSLGEKGITTPIPSQARTVAEIIAELSSTRSAERAGRVMDHEAEDGFERLRREGYM